MKRKTASALILIILLTSALTGCTKADTAPKIAEDEILLQIQLDLKEDIGLLVLDYEADGSGGSGGTSNANKSLLKRDELIYYSLYKDYFDASADVSSLSLRFTVITKYFTPNYDNIYPLDYTKPLEAVLLEAAYGKAYKISITGDNKNGYTAVICE